MKVIRNIEDIPSIKNAVLTNGTFDGTHAGHIEILNQLLNTAKDINGKSVVLTYWPHPRIVLGKEDSDFKLLFNLEERIQLLSEYNIDFLIILEFTKEFANTSSHDFISNILVNRIGLKKLVLGYNHRFGKNREGSFEYLKNNASSFGFEIEEIPKQIIDAEGVSSTKIRKALQDGDLQLANKYLQKKFFLNGEVIEGKKLGREIGFPTANIKVKGTNKLIPSDGVYAVEVILDNKKYLGMLNIGQKPTVNNEGRKSIEVHIFDFDQEVYGQNLTIFFVQKIRDEQKFNSLEQLKNQLSKDKLTVLEILEH